MGNRKNHRLTRKNGLPSRTGITEPIPIQLTISKVPVRASPMPVPVPLNSQTVCDNRLKAGPLRESRPAPGSRAGINLPENRALFPVLPHNLLPSRAIGYPQSKLHSTGRFISFQNALFPHLELK